MADEEEVTREEEIKLLEEMIADDSPIVKFGARKKSKAPPIRKDYLPNPPSYKTSSAHHLTPPPQCNKQCPHAPAVWCDPLLWSKEAGERMMSYLHTNQRYTLATLLVKGLILLLVMSIVTFI